MVEYYIDFYGRLQYGFLAVAANLLVAALIPVLLSKIELKKPKKLLLLAVQMIIAMAVMDLICAVYYWIFGQPCMSQICGAIVIAIYAVFFCKFKPVARIIMSLSYLVIFTLASMIWGSFLWISVLLSIGNVPTLDFSLLQGILVFMNAAIMIACTLFLKKFSINGFREFVPKSYILVFASNLAGIVLWVLANVIRFDTLLLMVLSITLLVLVMPAYYGIFATSNYISLSNRQRTWRLMREADKNLLHMSETNLETIHKLRHEIKNQHAYIKILADKGEYEKLKEHISAYPDKLMSSIPLADTGNQIINAILNMEISKAMQSGLEIRHRIAVPDEMNFIDIDLCSLLLNLLDNAIEYLERNNCIEDRHIDLELRKVNRTLLIKVENPIKDLHRESALSLETSKKDKSLHGYGSKVVKRIVDEYCGNIKYETANGKFAVSAMLAEPAAPAEIIK